MHLYLTSLTLTEIPITYTYKSTFTTYITLHTKHTCLDDLGGGNVLDAHIRAPLLAHLCVPLPLGSFFLSCNVILRVSCMVIYLPLESAGTFPAASTSSTSSACGEAWESSPDWEVSAWMGLMGGVTVTSSSSDFEDFCCNSDS